MRSTETNLDKISAATSTPLAFCTLALLVVLSCQQEVLPPSTEDGPAKQYVHLSHTLVEDPSRLDPVVEAADLSDYDMLWLGGDLTRSTSRDAPTLSHVDSVLHISKASTLWSLGNHDYADVALIEQYTDRPPYYSYHSDGITYLVLDTQDSMSHIVGEQRELVFSVLDTIATSSHLVVLHHKLMWMYGNADLEGQIATTSNGELGDCFWCLNPNNFTAEIYPRLVEVQQKGIQVLCVGGDLGKRTHRFEFETPEGIRLLASGIDIVDERNSALVFTHHLATHHLTWTYRRIGEL